MKALFVPTLALLALTALAFFCDEPPTAPTPPPPPPPPTIHYTLDSLEVVRILYPNGGDTVHYGDTIQVKWLGHYRWMSQMTLNYVNKDDGTFGKGIGLQNSGPDWIKVERDIPSGPHGSTVTLVNPADSIVLVTYPIILKDSTYTEGAVFFDGQSKFRVYHPYPNVNGSCEDTMCVIRRKGDASDNYFTIIR